MSLAWRTCPHKGEVHDVDRWVQGVPLDKIARIVFVPLDVDTHYPVKSCFEDTESRPTSTTEQIQCAVAFPSQTSSFGASARLDIMLPAARYFLAVPGA